MQKVTRDCEIFGTVIYRNFNVRISRLLDHKYSFTVILLRLKYPKFGF